MTALALLAASAGCSDVGARGLDAERLELGRAQQALLQQLGPTDTTAAGGGFPSWIKDPNGLRLALCLDANDPLCVAAPLPDPAAPIAFPDNFPSEAFWWSGNATIGSANGGSALLVMGLLAAFVGGGPPAAGQQVAFGRIRVRVDNLPVGHYIVTHPFGVDEYDVAGAQANRRRSINDTEDIGNLAGGAFEPVLGARVGPFLVWDDASALPAGYLADPAIPHRVIGSPLGTNFFQIEGPPRAFAGSADACPGANGALRDDCIRGDLFSVQAKRAANAGVEVVRATYTNDASGQFIDVLASSDLGQQIALTGASILQTPFVEGGGGEYFAEAAYTGSLPTDLEVLNLSDSPVTRQPLGALVDLVQVASASYFTFGQRLVVTAVSSDINATLSLSDFTPSSVIGTAGTPFTFSVENVAVPPQQIRVVSSAGGSASQAVLLRASVPPLPVNPVEVAPGPSLPIPSVLP